MSEIARESEYARIVWFAVVENVDFMREIIDKIAHLGPARLTVWQIGAVTSFTQQVAKVAVRRTTALKAD